MTLGGRLFAPAVVRRLWAVGVVIALAGVGCGVLTLCGVGVSGATSVAVISAGVIFAAVGEALRRVMIVEMMTVQIANLVSVLAAKVTEDAKRREMQTSTNGSSHPQRLRFRDDGDC